MDDALASTSCGMLIDPHDPPKHWHVREIHHLGVGVEIDDSVEIGTGAWPVEQLWVGDHVRIHGPSRFIPRRLVIGDYTHLYDGMWCGGDAERNGGPPGGDAYFGHNTWIAPNCVLDPTGGLYIGNGFGIGHSTHIWSHVRHGDVMVGSRYLSYGRFVAEHDVWLVGRCTANPIWCEPYSVALTSATLTRDMRRNRVYAGTPAIDITDKVGEPYQYRSTGERQAFFEEKLELFEHRHGRMTAADRDDLASRFDVNTRTYRKQGDPSEVALMRTLLPTAKFTPVGQERLEGVISWPER